MAKYSIWIDYEIDDGDKFQVVVFDEDDQMTDYDKTRRDIETYEEAEQVMQGIIKEYGFKSSDGVYYTEEADAYSTLDDDEDEMEAD